VFCADKDNAEIGPVELRASITLFHGGKEASGIALPVRR